MSFSYFNKLNYTLANEDTGFEYQMMPAAGLKHIVTVAGSGGRVLPLAAKQPERLTCVDLSQEQLFLTELRLEACKQLAREDFLKLFGYISVGAKEREDIFAAVKISDPARDFLAKVFAELKFESLLYVGKWEATFAKLAEINRRVVGSKGLGIFECQTLEEQIKYYESEFPRKRFRTVLFFLGNRSVFNALLYKGHFVKKNIEQSYDAFYTAAFNHLFYHTLLRENFFMEIIFFGKVVHESAWPVECDAKVFAESKAALNNCVIDYRQGNLLETIPTLGQKADFVGLSDVPSYFSGSVEKNFMQTIAPHVNCDGLVIVRSYLRVPFRPDLRGYENVSEQYASIAAREKTAMYLIDVYRKIN